MGADACGLISEKLRLNHWATKTARQTHITVSDKPNTNQRPVLCQTNAGAGIQHTPQRSIATIASSLSPIPTALLVALGVRSPVLGAFQISYQIADSSNILGDFVENARVERSD
jgi:hypothetical protein